jgi:tape measure domain-containing protein
MQFDNKNFEQNVHTSMSTLEKFKRALKLDGASKGLEHLSSQAKKCDITPLANSADKVSLRFSAMYTIADQALRNLVNSAERYAKRIVSAFTIDPIKTGFQEYETQINAVQTILANTQSKGTTLDDVNAALDELNKYADMTIYNFTEMTRNIGTFTAAGVDLDKAVTSIKGIANLAAVSGSTSQQASTAMYQLSQALASGKVSLMDWNSVVNAGMGGQLFQDALKRTAKHMGTDVDALIKKYGSFRESLTEGQWLTAEVLTETLTQLSGAYTEAELIAQGYTEEQAKQIAELADTAVNAATKVKTFTQLMDTLKEATQSGWTQTWELIVGDFEESKELWTKVSDVMGGFINNMSESRNRTLGGALNSNWDNLIAKINEAGISTDTFEEKIKMVAEEQGLNVDELIKKYGSLKNAIREGAISSNILEKAVKAVSKSAADLSIVDKVLGKGDRGDQVKEVQQALKDLGYDIGKTGVDGIIGKNTEAAIKAFQQLKGLKVTGVIDAETLAALKEAVKTSNALYASVRQFIAGIDELGGRELLLEAFSNIFSTIGKYLKAIATAFRYAFKPITSKQLYKIIEGFHKFTETLYPSGETLKKITTIFRGFFHIIEIGASIIGGTVGAAFKFLWKVLNNLDLGILDLGMHAGAAIIEFRNWFFENNILARSIDYVAESVANGIASFVEWFNTFRELPWVQNGIAKVGKAFDDTFGKIGEWLSGAREKFGEFFEYLKKLWKGEIFDASGITKAFNFKNIWTYFKEHVVDYFVKFDYSGLFKGIVDSFKKFKDDATKYLTGVGTAFTVVKDKIAGFFTLVKEYASENMGGIIALGILASFLLLLRGIKNAIDAISRPFSGIQDVLEGLSGALKGLAFNLKAQGIKAISESIAILAGSLLALAFIPAGKLWNAVGAITVIGIVVGGLALALGKVESLPDMAKLSLTLIGLSGALLILAMSLKIMGNLDGEAIGKGVLAITAFLGICWAMTKLSQSLKSGVSFVGFGKMVMQLSTSLILLAVATKIFGTMEWEELKKGGAAFGVFILGMITVMEYSGKLGPRLPQFAQAMKGLSAALLIAAVAIKIFGGMTWEELGKGGAAFVVFMGTMVGMMAATNLLAKDMPKFGRTMIGLSAGLLTMAVTIKILAGISNEDLVKGGLVMTGFLGLMVGMMAATKLLGEYSGNASKIGLMMLSFSGAMIVMAGAIALLSELDAKDIWKAIGAISAVTVLFGALLAASGYMKSGKKATNVITKLAIAVGVLAISIAALSFIPAEKILRATAALSIVIGAFAGLTYASKFAGKKIIGTIITLSVAIGVLAAAIAVVANMTDANSALKIAGGLSALILALSGSIVLLGKMGHVNTKDLYGAILAVGALLGVVGLVVGAFAAVAFAALPKIGTQLSTFANNAGDFFQKVQNLKPQHVLGLKILAESIGILAEASFVGGIGSLMPGGLAKPLNAFTEWVKTIIPIIVDMAKQISSDDVKIDSEKLDAIMTALRSICEAASMAPTTKVAGGLIKVGKAIAGGLYIQVPHMKAFATWIGQVVPAIKDLAVTVSGLGENLNVDGVNGVMASVLTLSEAANKGPSFSAAAGFVKMGKLIAFGGAWEWPRIESFATWISTVCTSLGDLSSKLKTSNFQEVDYTGLAKIITSVESLGTAVGMLESNKHMLGIAGGTAGPGIWWIGGAGAWSFPDLDGFGNWVTTVADELGGLADTCKSLNLSPEDYAGLASLLQSVEYLGKAVENSPGVVIAGGIGNLGNTLGSTWKDKLKGLLAGGVDWPLISEFAEWIETIMPVMTRMAVIIDAFDIDTETYDGINRICESVNLLSQAMINVPNLTIAGGGGKLFNQIVAGGTVLIPQIGAFADFIEKVVPAMGGVAVALRVFKCTSTDYETLNQLAKALSTIMSAGDKIPVSSYGFGGIGGKWGGGIYASWDYVEFEKFSSWISTIIPQMAQLAIDLRSYNLNTTDFTNLTKITASVNTLATAASKIPHTKFALFGGGAGGGFGGGGAFGVYNEITQWTEFIQFIKDIQQPMVELANALRFDKKGTKWDFSGVTSVCEGVAAMSEAFANVPKTVIAAAAGGAGWSGHGGGGIIPYVNIPLVQQFGEWYGQVLPAMTDLVKALSGQGVDGGINLLEKGKYDFGKITTICEAVAAMSVAMDHVPSFGVDVGGGMLAKLGNSWGGYLGVNGPFISQFAQWIDDVLDAMQELVIALAGAELLDGEHDFSGITTICEGIAAIGEAGDNMPSVDVTSIIGGGAWGFVVGNRTEVPLIQQFAEFIKSAATGLKDIAAALAEAGLMTNDTDWTGIGAICDGIAAISQEVKMPEKEVSIGLAGIGPVFGFWTSVKTPMLAEFGEWIKTIAPVISQFAIDISNASANVDGGLDLTAVKTVCRAVKTLGEAASLVPTEEETKVLFGAWSDTKTPDLTGFTNWLVGDGTDSNPGMISTLKTLSEELSNVTINESAVMTAATAGKLLGEMASMIPTENEGWASWWSKDVVQWDDFNTNITSFAEAIVSFSDTLTNGSINETVVTTAATAGKILAETGKIITEWWYTLTEYNMSGFNTLLNGSGETPGLAGALVTFSQTVAGINLEATSTAATAALNISKTLLNLGTYDYDSFDSKEFSTACTEIAKAMTKFADDLSGINTSAPISDASSLAALITGMSAMDFTGASAFEKAMGDLSKTGIKEFIDKFTNSKQSVEDAANTLVDNATTAMKSEDNYEDFKSAGKYLVEGLAEGIKNNSSLAEDAAAAVVNAAEQAARDAGLIESPSKVWYELGFWSVKGYANALHDGLGTAYSSGYDVSEAARSGLNSAISKMRDVVELGFDTQPTIRPVLDLSDVSAGARSINGMFDMRPSMGVMANVNAIGSMMNSRRQNGSNRDVVSAIEDLGRKIGDRSGDTYNFGNFTYDDGSNINTAVKTLVRAAKMERRK